MQMLCPHCGGELSADAENLICPHCASNLRRVPDGKAFRLIRVREISPEEEAARAALRKALAIEAPDKRRKALLDAEASFPDCFDIQVELLHLGRLGENSKAKLDYHIIKSYLLHAFEEPEQEPQRDAMLRELVDDPRLTRCRQLAEDEPAFVQAYLKRLCKEYLTIFLKGNNSKNGRLMGFQIVRLEKALAPAAARMRREMERWDAPAGFETLPRLLTEAFAEEIGSTVWLEEAYQTLKEKP